MLISKPGRGRRVSLGKKEKVDTHLCRYSRISIRIDVDAIKTREKTFLLLTSPKSDKTDNEKSSQVRRIPRALLFVAPNVSLIAKVSE